MSISILYIGNKLQKHGFTPTSIETLGEKMKEFADVKQVSDVRSMPLRILHMWWAILTCPKGHKVVIDTYSTTAFNFAWTSGILCKLRGLPYVPVLRGGDLPHRYDKSPGKMKRYLDNCLDVIAPSTYLQKELGSRWGKMPSLIPNYIELENYKFKKRDTIKPKMLWVRAFHETYNPLMAIDVLEEVLKKYPGAELCMVGPDKDGTMEQTKTYAKERGVEARVQIPGRMSKPDWLALSEKYDVFINTTNFDNTPVSVIEAMALGLPVVSTNVGGIPDLFENGKEGIQTSIADHMEMAGAVKSLVQDGSTAVELATNARTLVDNFSWSKVKESWKQLLS